jgi:Mg2+/citrate symporter
MEETDVKVEITETVSTKVGRWERFTKFLKLGWLSDTIVGRFLGNLLNQKDPTEVKNLMAVFMILDVLYVFTVNVLKNIDIQSNNLQLCEFIVVAAGSLVGIQMITDIFKNNHPNA